MKIMTFRIGEVPSSMTTADRRLITAAAVGQFVEWYDFLIYAILTPFLAANFFPRGNLSAAILGSFAVYGAGFLMRPLGGIVCGKLGDRVGRRNILSFTVILMGGATLACGLLPTYASIGLAAPALLFLLRLIQGFAAGGEASSMGPLVLESAPSAQRGRWIAIAFAASYLPSGVGGFLVIGLESFFGPSDWVWRTPFIIGGVLAGIGFFIRMRVKESAEFVDMANSGNLSSHPLKDAITIHGKAITLTCLIIALLAAGGYTIHSFMFTYLVSTVGMSRIPATCSTALSVFFIVFFLPYCGRIADKVGRRPMMFAGAGWLAVTAFPCYLLCSLGTFGSALAAQIVLSVGVCLFGGGGYVTLYELFPTNVRSSGIGLAYNLGFAIFGGTMPFISQLLVNYTGYPLAPSFYLMFVAVVTFFVVKAVPETLGSDLKVSLFSPETRNDH